MAYPTVVFLRDQLRPYRRTITWLGVVAIVAAAFDTIIPILYGRALDVVVTRQPITSLATLLAVWLVLRLMTDALQRTVRFRGQEIAHHASVTFVRRATDRLLDLHIAAHHAQRGGEIEESVRRTSEAFRQFLRMGVFDLFPSILTIAAISAYLFTVDVLLGVVNLVVIAAFLVRSRAYIPRFDAAWERHANAERKFAGRRWDAIRNILVVKSSTAEAHERAAGDRLSADVIAAHVDAERSYRRHSAEHDTIYGIGTVAVFAIASLRIASGDLTPGQLVTVFGYSFSTWGIIRGAVWTFWTAIELRVQVRKYAAIAQLATEPYGVGAVRAIRGAVEFRNVSFRYRVDTEVIEDVTFSARAGETVAIVGESGEGKTTIVELLSRYWTPQSGEIRIDGVPIEAFELGCLRSQLAYVPQDLTLFHESIRDNIRYGRLDATDADVEGAAQQAALHVWITSLPEGYATIVGERGLKLSAGQRQRVAIARAFLRNPKILILDEPTSNLDAATEAEIHESLRALMRGRTTFVIAHRLRTVQDADRIIVLHDGHVAESGTHAQLMRESNGIYRRLRDLQFHDAEGGASAW